MTQEAIPDEDRLARQCSRNHFVDPEAMTELKLDTFRATFNNPEPSVNWLEYYEGDDALRIELVCKDISSHRQLKPHYKLALLQVIRLRELGSTHGHVLNAHHDPKPSNDSHAVIRGIPPSDKTQPVPWHIKPLLQDLADAASENIVPVNIDS